MRFEDISMLSVVDRKGLRPVYLNGFWYRLIPSRFPTIDLYERVALAEHAAIVKDIETLTNPRARAKDLLTRGSNPVAETSPKLQNWNHAPFTYRNPDGSRFLSEHYGVLELSETLETALAVAIRKREAFLSATAQPRLALDMRVLKHEIDGHFVDLRHEPVDMPREERWAIGEQLLARDAQGVYFRTPERPNGFCVAVFDNEVLGPSLQAQHYRFVWDGTRISALYDYRDGGDGTPILPESLFAC